MFFFLLFILCSTATDTRIIVVELDSVRIADAILFAAEHSLELLADKEYTNHLPPHFWALRAEHHRTRYVSKRLNASSRVLWHEVQTPKRRYTRNNAREAPLLGRSAVASDPLYASQWHLHGNANSMNVESAWRAGITGKGVTVAIVDDGVQMTHPDLVVNRAYSRDYNSNRGTDCSPYTTDGHGTSASGVCCAKRNNGQCGSGVAPDSTLAGIRLIAEPTTDLMESMALSHKHINDIDVYSCSWGPMDDGVALRGPGRLTRMVLKQNTADGRKGKGNVYVWAGGNGRDNGDNCNYDSYANSIYTIAVGAVDHLGYQSWYSESCSALFVSAPSSGSRLGITTTDLTGRNGYANGQCCSSFGGTSSAAPAVAGAVALLLQKRPDLTWRDVQHVLAKSSKQPVSGASHGVANSRGYIHDERFGFGRVDIPNMLLVAEHWTLVVPSKVKSFEVTHKEPHSGSARPKVVATFDMTDGIEFVEHVTVSMVIRHSSRGQLKIQLTSPSGIISTLFAPHDADNHADIPGSHLFMSVRHWGERVEATQKWTLSVHDTTRNSNFGTGYLRGATLKIHGY